MISPAEVNAAVPSRYINGARWPGTEVKRLNDKPRRDRLISL